MAEQAAPVIVHQITPVEVNDPNPLVIAYSADVEWTEFNATRSTFLFIGNKAGAPGPIYTVINNTQVEVLQPERFGIRFNEDWVRNFYA